MILFKTFVINMFIADNQELKIIYMYMRKTSTDNEMIHITLITHTGIYIYNVTNITSYMNSTSKYTYILHEVSIIRLLHVNIYVHKSLINDWQTTDDTGICQFNGNKVCIIYLLLEVFRICFSDWIHLNHKTIITHLWYFTIQICLNDKIVITHL